MYTCDQHFFGRDRVKSSPTSGLRTAAPLRVAAERLVDAFIELYQAVATTSDEYETWRDLPAFEAVEGAVNALELTLSRQSSDQEEELYKASASSVRAFHALHDVEAVDSDGELFQEFDDAMYHLGAHFFGKAHAH